MKRIFALLLLLLVASGCAHWPDRPPVPASAQARAQLVGYHDIRYFADAPLDEWLTWRDRWLADRRSAGQRASVNLLAISSGSDKGAFAAGFLKGWSRRGTRPTFDVVTGVSTGALIAPFAFLGSSEDSVVEQLFTGISARDIFRATPVSGVLGGPSLAQTRPLQQLIARYIDVGLLDRIAAEHRRGRRLLVMTTNLDAGRGVVWDMGAIAASNRPDRVALFRQILLASASIPGVFPPVLIDVAAEGRHFNEMHVDGGTVSSLFALPSSVLWQGAGVGLSPARGSTITVLYNGKLQRTYRIVQPRAFGIIAQALATVIGEADRQNIESYRVLAERNGVAMRVEAIQDDFTAKEKGIFETRFMRALFTYGFERGAAPQNVAVSKSGISNVTAPSLSETPALETVAP